MTAHAPADLWARYAEHRATVRAFVDAELRPHAAAWEAAGGTPREVFARAGAAGLLGWKVPPDHGGRGPDALADLVVSEELAAARSGGVAAALGASKDLGAFYIWRFGTPEQRRRWVPAACAGEAVTALAVTEPGAGSDVAALRTRAMRHADGSWVLSGTKTFITNGPTADVIVVAALTDPAAGGHRGTSLFLVEPGDAGFTATRIPTLGWRTSHTGELSFADVRLPADRLLGGEAALGQGFVAIMRNFQWERLGMALGAVRGAEENLRTALPHVRDAVDRRRLADAAVRVAGARALTEAAIRRWVGAGTLDAHGVPAPPVDDIRATSMAKLHACEVAQSTAETALAVLAGAPAPAPAEVLADAERALRDSRLGPIGGGTTEVMLELVARALAL